MVSDAHLTLRMTPKESDILFAGAGCFNCMSANVACYVKLGSDDGVLTLKGLLVWAFYMGQRMQCHTIAALRRCWHTLLVQK